MNRTTILWTRIGLTLTGLALFVLGVRGGDERVRYAAIGAIALALLLRFIRPRD